MIRYRIDPALDIPIYQQLVDAIRTDIKKGDLPDGTQLPTVQTLSEELGIARGTIKRAYDQLAHMGLVSLVQGRGTFVSYHPTNAASRKEKAMIAIDGLLNRLEEMGLSASEISILMHAKLQERAEQLSHVKVAIVECNPETLSQLADQLRDMEHVEIYSYLFDNLRSHPDRLDGDLVLIITTPEHAPFLETIVPDQKKIARIALRLSPRSVAGIVKLQAGDELGIFCSSLRFGALLHETCRVYTEQVNVSSPYLLHEELYIDKFLRGKTAVLVPEELEKYASPETLRKLTRFARKGRVIRCSYEMDDGSFLYIQEKISRLREKKNS